MLAVKNPKAPFRGALEILVPAPWQCFAGWVLACGSVTSTDFSGCSSRPFRLLKAWSPHERFVASYEDCLKIHQAQKALFFEVQNVTRRLADPGGATGPSRPVDSYCRTQ